MANQADDYSEDMPTSQEPANEAGPPRSGLVPHPLFPRPDRTPENRDIRFVSFCRKLPDGRVEFCPEDIPAQEIKSWADVTALWGGGEYRAIGKDQFHQEVARHPARDGAWVLFNFESRPLTPRDGARHTPAPPYGHGMHGAPYAPPYGHGMHGAPPYAPPYGHGTHGAPPYAPPYGHAPAYGHGTPGPAYAPPYGHGMHGAPPHDAPHAHGVHAPPPYADGTQGAPPYAPPYAPAPAAAPPPAAQSRLEAQVAELRAHVVELTRELHASHATPPASAAPAPASSNENVLIAVINSAQAAAAREAESMRAMVTAMINQRAADAKPAADSTTSAITLVKEIHGLIQPASPQSPVGDTIEHFKALKEISTPPATSGSGQPQSELSELINGFTTIMQAEASKSAVAAVTEPPKPAPPERRSRPRDLFRWPGYGVVEVVEPELPMSAAPPPPPPPPAARGLDMETIKRDPVLRARALSELGVDVSAMSAAPLAPPPMSSAPAPMPEPPPPMPSAPAPMSEPPPPPMPMPSTPAPARDVNIEALLADPVQRARVLQLLIAAIASEPSQVAESAPIAPPAATSQPATSTASPTTAAPAPIAPAPIAPAPIAPPPPAQTVPTPTKPIVPAPIVPPTKPTVSAPIAPPPPPIAPAASHDKRAPNAEPARTAGRVPTPYQRARAIPSLRVIARLSPEQRRAEIRKLPGMEEGAVDGLTEALGLMVNLPPEAWTQVAALLPPEAVWALVGGVGG